MDGELEQHEELAELQGRYALALATNRLTRGAYLYSWPHKLLTVKLDSPAAAPLLKEFQDYRSLEVP